MMSTPKEEGKVMRAAAKAKEDAKPEDDYFPSPDVLRQVGSCFAACFFCSELSSCALFFVLFWFYQVANVAVLVGFGFLESIVCPYFRWRSLWAAYAQLLASHHVG